MTDRESAPETDEKIGDTDVTREENVRTATHWGTPPDPEAVQDTREMSDQS